MIDLRGKVALVTGASRGIGRACVESLTASGAAVVVNYLNSHDAAKDLVNSIQNGGGRAIAVRADVSERDDVLAMIDVIGNHFGKLDIVVSNAAAGGFRPLTQVTPAGFDAILRMNAAPLLWLTQAALPLFQASQEISRVIAISSHGSIRGIPNYGLIGSSKAALESLVRHLAFELGRSGINFNAVMPGIVATEAIKTLPGSAEMLAFVQEQILVRKRTLQPADVAGTVLFLASALSDLIQGQVIVVDGGISIRV
ncbi:MAG TPA: SDR family oxidoreductase [Planctomycetaceae bacterium]|nr:SDR family oxidoreductase [Planctomycetaceae bacterium]